MAGVDHRYIAWLKSLKDNNSINGFISYIALCTYNRHRIFQLTLDIFRYNRGSFVKANFDVDLQITSM